MKISTLLLLSFALIPFAFAGSVAEAELTSAYAAPGDGSGHSGGGGRFSKTGGIITCYEAASGNSLRFIPFVTALEFRTEASGEYSRCTSTYQVNSEQSPSRDLTEIDQKLGKLNGLSNKGLNTWFSDESVAKVKLKTGSDYGVSGQVFECDSRKFYLRVSAGTVPFFMDSYIASTGFKVVEETHGSTTGEIFSTLISPGLKASSSPKVQSGWSCTNYDPNFLGNYLGPWLNLDKPWVL